MPFEFSSLSIPDVILIKFDVKKDARGFFQEIYKMSIFRKNGITPNFVQDNLSYSSLGTLRGLHYQVPPKAQGKLLIVISGSVFDVAVDVRRDSSTYGQWVGQELSNKNNYSLYIPPGFAHGFCVMSNTAIVLYKVTEEYAPELEYGIIWNDPAIGIKWPVDNPILSMKDSKLPVFEEAKVF